ncbi:MAG: hypothetical protein F6K16_00050 [Symploca sp. SIO2B6]|nr:hypothetical protein [Symploca sp. SIO2B6]
MKQNQGQNNSGQQQPNQQQALGDVQVQGDDNIFNVIQAEIVTLTQTKIIQISVDEIKTRQLISTSPYKGLRSFEPEDRNQFFGRDQFIAELVNELEQTNLVLLLGASGSGKSSVVRAGLIPWLREKLGTRLVNLILNPDQDPFESLYGSLLGHFKQSEAQIARARKVDTLSQMVEALKQPESFWFIFIDQFEELFTTSNPDQRDCFITSLRHLCEKRSSDRTLKIVATMRADFLDRLDSAPANHLAKVTQKHRPLITQMHPDELRQAIEQPAAHNGVVYEAGLVKTIIKDVQGQAGYLPLLQYTLNRLWETEQHTPAFQQERMLYTHTYLQLGGVRGTLQRHVDNIYGQLQQEGKHLVTQRIFLKLVGIEKNAESGTEWKPVRRRANQSEFNDLQEKTVLAQLVDQKLIVSNRDVFSQSQESTFEIAHEILLTSWTTLNSWIKENRQGIALRSRLNEDVKLWQAKRADNDLWSGSKLEQVLELLENTTFNQVLGGFSPAANEFIKASLGKRDRELRFYRNVSIGAIAALICITGSLFVAGFQWKAADRGQFLAPLTSSKALFDINPTSLDTLRASLKAATQLQQSFWFKNNPKLRAQAMEMLAQAVYAVREQNRLEGHTGYINSVSFSPDGEMIGTASYDKTAKLWSADGKYLQTLEGHKEQVTDISFSRDGQTIATASRDDTVILWNREGKNLQILEGHKGNVWSVHFSPDGHKIATASGDQTVKLWDLKGKLLNTLSGHTKPVYMVRFSPEEEILATASEDKTIKLWNFQGEELHPFQGHSDQVLSVNFSRDGQTIASASTDKTVILWDLNTKDKIITLQGHEGTVYDAIFSPDGQTIASASEDDTVKLWRRDGTLLETLRGHKNWVNSISFSPDGNVLASASNDQTIKLWKWNTWRTSFVGHNGIIYSVAISPDGKTIASAGKDATVNLWNFQGKIIAKLRGHNNQVDSVSFSPDSKMLVTASTADKTVKVWNLQERKVIKTHKERYATFSANFSLDGKTILFGSRDKTVKLWNYEEDHLESLEGHTAAVMNVSFSPDNSIIASADENGTVRLWSRNGSPLRTWPAHTGAIFSIGVSSDNQTIATGGQDNLVKLWDQEGNLLHTLKGHTESVSEVRFSLNGQIIATASRDKTVKLWTDDGKLITTLIGHNDSVRSLSFTPDSKMLATVSDDSRLLLWNLENLTMNSLITRGCNWLQEDLKANSDVVIEKVCSRMEY